MINKGVLVLSLTAALFMAAVPAQARHADMKEPERVSLTAPDGQKPDIKRMQAAIREAAVQNGWLVRGDSPGKMTLRYNRREHEAVIDVIYDASSYQIKYVSSVELGYRSKDGKTEIHPVYNEWINNLQRRIENSYAAGAH